MHTSLDLDLDVLSAARDLAGRQQRSLGEVVSDLARKGLRASEVPAQVSRNGFPLFIVPTDAAVVTPEDMRHDEDEA